MCAYIFSAYMGLSNPVSLGKAFLLSHLRPHWNESSKLGKLQPPTSFGAKYRAKQPAFLDKNVWPKRVWVILISLIYSKIVLYMSYTIYVLFWCFFAKNETCERLKCFAEKYKQKTRKWSNLMLQDSWKYHPCKSFLDVSTHGLKKWWPFFIFDPIRCGKKPSWWKLLQRKRRFNPSLQRIWNTFSTRKLKKKTSSWRAPVSPYEYRMNEDVCCSGLFGWKNVSSYHLESSYKLETKTNPAMCCSYVYILHTFGSEVHVPLKSPSPREIRSCSS